MRVLVVDDSRIARQVLCRTLVGLGFPGPDQARDGAEALDLIQARAQPYDLIICDLMMPGLDGIGFLQGLKTEARDLLTRVPVMVITSEADPERLGQIMRLGAIGYVTKPFSPRLLRRRIRYATRMAWFLRKEAVSLALEASPETVLTGELDQVAVLELLQFLAVHHKSGTIEVTAKGMDGRIHLQDGQIIGAHAAVSVQMRLVGLEALERMVEQLSGRFAFGPPEPVVIGQIEQPTLMLIFELARYRDETNREQVNGQEPGPPG